MTGGKRKVRYAYGYHPSTLSCQLMKFGISVGCKMENEVAAGLEIKADESCADEPQPYCLDDEVWSVRKDG